MSMDVKGSDIRKHATAGGSNDTATLHLQLVRGAKAVGKTAALPPTDSLNETTRPDVQLHLTPSHLSTHGSEPRSPHPCTFTQERVPPVACVKHAGTRERRAPDQSCRRDRGGAGGEMSPPPLQRGAMCLPRRGRPARRGPRGGLSTRTCCCWSTDRRRGGN